MQTFAKAREAIWAHLKAEGWTMSNPMLKVTHATNARGFRLWFKAQAVYYSQGTTLGDARSIHVDIRALDIPAFMSYIGRWEER